jgi:hypothetical protein
MKPYVATELRIRAGHTGEFPPVFTAVKTLGGPSVYDDPHEMVERSARSARVKLSECAATLRV